MSATDQVAQLRATTQGRLTWHAAAMALGYPSSEALRSQVRRERRASGETSDEEEYQSDDNPELVLQFTDKKHREKISWRDLTQHAIRTQKIDSRLSDQQKSAKAHIKTTTPIAVVFTGDWHFGDGATDHETWYRDMELMLGSDNVFIIDLGDSIQNMRTFKTLSGVLGQALSPKQQAAAMASLIEEMTMSNKILAKVDGNHDAEFDERIFGEALQQYYRTCLKAPVFSNRGLLELKVGKEVYWMLLYHKSRFSSIFRPSHGAYREAQMFAPADIIAGAHDHLPSMEALPMYTAAREAGMGLGGLCYLLKIGTYQDSAYGWKYFHNGGKPLNWTAVLWPNEHKIQMFTNTSDAIQFMQALGG